MFDIGVVSNKAFDIRLHWVDSNGNPWAWQSDNCEMVTKSKIDGGRGDLIRRDVRFEGQLPDTNLLPYLLITKDQRK